MSWTPETIIAFLMLLMQSGLIQALVDLITAIFGGGKTPDQVHAMVMGVITPLLPPEVVDAVSKLVRLEVSKRSL